MSLLGTTWRPRATGASQNCVATLGVVLVSPVGIEPTTL